jgi:hypothetical protein
MRYILMTAIVLALSGCQSPRPANDWPYQGPPMVGTNTIPVPKW